MKLTKYRKQQLLKFVNAAAVKFLVDNPSIYTSEYDNFFEQVSNIINHNDDVGEIYDDVVALNSPFVAVAANVISTTLNHYTKKNV